MSRSKMSQLERDLYLASRTVGDVNAMKSGRYPQRIVKRYWHRWLFQQLRKMGL